MFEKDDKNNNRKRAFYYYFLIFIIIMFINSFITPGILESKVREVDYSYFLNQVAADKVDTVQIDENQIQFTLKKKEPAGKSSYYRLRANERYKTGKVNDPNLVEELRAKDVKFGAVIPNKTNYMLILVLSYAIPILIFVFIGKKISKSLNGKFGGGAGGLALGGNAGKMYVPSIDSNTFDDVAGQEEAKEALQEIIGFLASPEKYRQIGAKCPKGALLVGPPGTGKTLIAKAVAGEANVPFFSISGSEFVEMFVGRGAAKVRDLFEQASKKSPCIVFIDEIDTIGKKRDAGGLSGNDEREQTLNQLLTEMDGFDATNKNVVILAATNRPEILDPALLRPGRFDRQIRVELPDLQGRIDILKVHAKNYKMEDNIDYDLLARATSGASGAELANIVNEASLRAVKFNRSRVSHEDLEESIEVVIAGQQKKNAILSPQEKKIVSYHEIGHALVAALQTQSAPVHKITIIPRTSGALGYTMQVEEREKSLTTRTELLNKMATICGGRAAEELIFGEYTTGAANDIEQITKIARAMVTKLGMSSDFDMMALETGGSRYLGGDSSLNCSPETAKKIDDEVNSLIKEAHLKAFRILEENREKLHELAEYLLHKETITGDEFMQILNKNKEDEI